MPVSKRLTPCLDHKQSPSTCCQTMILSWEDPAFSTVKIPLFRGDMPGFLSYLLRALGSRRCWPCRICRMLMGCWSILSHYSRFRLVYFMMVMKLYLPVPF